MPPTTTPHRSTRFLVCLRHGSFCRKKAWKILGRATRKTTSHCAPVWKRWATPPTSATSCCASPHWMMHLVVPKRRSSAVWQWMRRIRHLLVEYLTIPNKKPAWCGFFIWDRCYLSYLAKLQSSPGRATHLLHQSRRLFLPLRLGQLCGFKLAFVLLLLFQFFLAHFFLFLGCGFFFSRRHMIQRE